MIVLYSFIRKKKCIFWKTEVVANCILVSRKQNRYYQMGLQMMELLEQIKQSGHPPPQTSTKSFLNGIHNIKCIFAYTQFQYMFESDLRLPNTVKRSMFLHAYIQTVQNHRSFTFVFYIWVLPLQNVSNFTKNY